MLLTKNYRFFTTKIYIDLYCHLIRHFLGYLIRKHNDKKIFSCYFELDKVFDSGYKIILVLFSFFTLDEMSARLGVSYYLGLNERVDLVGMGSWTNIIERFFYIFFLIISTQSVSFMQHVVVYITAGKPGKLE